MPGAMYPPCDFNLESPAHSVPSCCIAGLSSSPSGAWLGLLRGFATGLWKLGAKPLMGYIATVSLFLPTCPCQEADVDTARLCSVSLIRFQTHDQEELVCECGVGSSFHHFPCDLSAPLLLVSPLNTTADHFHVTLKMVFCSVPLGESVWPPWTLFCRTLGPNTHPCALASLRAI